MRNIFFCYNSLSCLFMGLSALIYIDLRSLRVARGDQHCLGIRTSHATPLTKRRQASMIEQDTNSNHQPYVIFSDIALQYCDSIRPSLRSFYDPVYFLSLFCPKLTSKKMVRLHLIRAPGTSPSGYHDIQHKIQTNEMVMRVSGFASFRPPKP